MPGSRETPPIRILIAAMPATLADIIAGLVAGEADMTVIGQTSSREETLAAVATLRPAVVILRLPEEGCAALLAACDGARVLAIGAEGLGATLQELRPQRRDLGEFSAARLVEGIRAAG